MNLVLGKLYINSIKNKIIIDDQKYINVLIIKENLFIGDIINTIYILLKYNLVEFF